MFSVLALGHFVCLRKCVLAFFHIFAFKTFQLNSALRQRVVRLWFADDIAQSVAYLSAPVDCLPFNCTAVIFSKTQDTWQACTLTIYLSSSPSPSLSLPPSLCSSLYLSLALCLLLSLSLFRHRVSALIFIVVVNLLSWLRAQAYNSYLSACVCECLHVLVCITTKFSVSCSGNHRHRYSIFYFPFRHFLRFPLAFPCCAESSFQVYDLRPQGVLDSHSKLSPKRDKQPSWPSLSNSASHRRCTKLIAEGSLICWSNVWRGTTLALQLLCTKYSCKSAITGYLSVWQFFLAI